MKVWMSHCVTVTVIGFVKKTIKITFSYRLDGTIDTVNKCYRKLLKKNEIFVVKTYTCFTSTFIAIALEKTLNYNLFLFVKYWWPSRLLREFLNNFQVWQLDRFVLLFLKLFSFLGCTTQLLSAAFADPFPAFQRKLTTSASIVL